MSKNIKADKSPAAVEKATTEKVDTSLADAHAEIQSDHQKAHPAYLLSEVRKLQNKKGSK